MTTTQRHFLIKVSGVDGFFASKTGGETTAETSEDFDGGSLDPEILGGPPRTSPITIRRGFKPERDAHMLRLFRPLVGALKKTITIQPTDEQLVAVGSPFVYEGLLTGLEDPEIDANSNERARVGLTFSVKKVS